MVRLLLDHGRVANFGEAEAPARGSNSMFPITGALRFEFTSLRQGVIFSGSISRYFARFSKVGPNKQPEFRYDRLQIALPSSIQSVVGLYWLRFPQLFRRSERAISD